MNRKKWFSAVGVLQEIRGVGQFLDLAYKGAQSNLELLGPFIFGSPFSFPLHRPLMLKNESELRNRFASF